MTGTSSDTQNSVSQGAASKTEFLIQAADFYIQKDGLFVLEEDQQVRLAISKLGLSSLKPFIPK
jgi:flagellar hook protein FlgE